MVRFFGPPSIYVKCIIIEGDGVQCWREDPSYCGGAYQLACLFRPICPIWSCTSCVLIAMLCRLSVVGKRKH